MFLLNDQLVYSYVNQRSSTLDIWNFEKSNLQHTFYYFRLGQGDNSREKNLILEPNEFRIILSHETFALSNKIMGLFGQASDITNKGVLLVHSPFIDPLFRGQLSLGIRNLNNIPITLTYGEDIIGKISFFDISDTYPITVSASSKVGKKFSERDPEQGDESLHESY